MLAGTSAEILVGTCWKKFLSAFPLPSALLGTEKFFPLYVLPGTRGFLCSGGTEKGFSCSGGTEKGRI